MFFAFKRTAVVAALALTATVSAQAATTTLTFSEVVGVHTTLNYSGTAGGQLTVTPSSGSLVILAGELGVAQWNNWDSRIGAGESITFTFQNAVQLIGWDMDDLNLGGSNQFKVKVGGGATHQFSLDSHSATPGTLVGKTFAFGYSGDRYYIDTLKFASVTAVPEPSGVAMLVAGLGVAGLVARRRKAA